MEEQFQRLLAQHGISAPQHQRCSLRRRRVRLAVDFIHPLPDTAGLRDRLESLRDLLPGVPERALELLARLSDAVAADESDPAPNDSSHPSEPARAAQRGRQLLAGAEATVALGRVLEGVQLELLAGLATEAGRELLRREHGEVDPGALSRTKRERWRARTKSLVAHEFQAASGFGIQDCHDRVGFALAPGSATGPARAALEAGRTDWWAVWQWWKRCRHLDPDSATDVATVVFPSPPADVTEPSRERAPVCSRRQFLELLDREATRVAGQDGVAARQARRAAVQRRRVRASVDSDGTGCLTVTGRTSTVVAAVDRIDAIAARARAAGDSRSLDQLRSDAALALLTSGILPGPGATAHAPGGQGPAPEGQGHAPDGHHPSHGRDVDQPGAARDDQVDPASGGGWDPATLDRLSAVLAGHVPATVEVVIPYDVLTGANPDGVALLTGHGHLTGEHAREVALTPGSVFYRLVTDPASGALVDRSSSRYQPDDQMRAIVTAADRYCRGPGCTIPAVRSQVDHVTPHPDGATAVSNLAALHAGHHALKTNRWWSYVMDPTGRVCTWSSFYGRIYTTAPFEYAALTTTPPLTAGSTDPPPGELLADLQDQLVYAALAHRDPGSALAGPDDDHDPGNDLWAPRARPLVGDPDSPVTLTHTGPDGRSRPGSPTDQPRPEDLLDRHAADTDRSGHKTGDRAGERPGETTADGTGKGPDARKGDGTREPTSDRTGGRRSTKGPDVKAEAGSSADHGPGKDPQGSEEPPPPF